MLRNAVLEAMAVAVEQGEEAAAHAVATCDPVIRPWLRRRVRETWEAALLETRVAAAGEGARHVLRLAYLREARRGVRERDDVRAVAAAYAEARLARGRVRRVPWWRRRVASFAAAVLVLAAVVAAGRWVAHAIEPPARADATRRAAPMPAGAYARGGAPEPQPALERALGRALPEYLVVLDRWARAGERSGLAGRARLEPQLALAAARVMSLEARVALGEEGTARLAEVLRAARRAASATPASAAQQAALELYAAIGAFDDHLATRGLGYLIDGDVIVGRRGGGRHVVLYAFIVESVRLFEAGGAPMRALELRRLDRLDAEQEVLGFARPHLRDALVRLDELEETLVAVVLPAMAPASGLRMADVDADLMKSPWSQAVRARAGQVVREELEAALGEEAAAAGELGALLRDRHRILLGWREALLEKGLRLTLPRTLAIPEGYLDALEGLVPAEELAELRGVAARLEHDAHAEVLALVRAVMARSIARHEAQHRLDYAQAVPRRYPEALARLVGPLATRDGRERTDAVMARDELSAYLGELARDPVTPRLNLTLLSRFLLDTGRWGEPEHFVALVVFEGLAADLGIAHEPLRRDGHVVRANVAAVYLALCDLPPERLRGAAGRLWERLFGEALPKISD